MTDSPVHTGDPNDVTPHDADRHAVDRHAVDQHEVDQDASGGGSDAAVEPAVDPIAARAVDAAVPGPATRPSADLAAIERDLDGVETALQRLDDGSYWTDEVTGEPIADEVLAADPVTRRTG